MFSDLTPLNINVAGYMTSIDNPHARSIEQAYPVDDLYAYVEHAFNHYEEVLINTPHVWDWFQARQIDLTHPLISQFRLGFADRTLCKNFGRDKGRQSDIVRGAWQRLGILKPSGHQYFHGDVVFPFIDSDDHICGAYGRRITLENRLDHVYHHHWFNGDQTFFNRQVLEDFNTVVLCKSPVEALVLISAGQPNVISTMGLYSFGQAHLRELREYRPSEVILAFDNSDSGNHVSGLIAQALSSVDIRCSRLSLPRNHDIVELARCDEDCYDTLDERINNARPFGQSYENILGGI